MDARKEILGRLTSALGRQGIRVPPEDPSPLAPATRMTVTRAEGDKEALARRFGEELLALHGSYHVAETVDEAREALFRQVKAWSEAQGPDDDAGEWGGVRRLLSWAPELLGVPGIEEEALARGYELFVPDDLAEPAARDRARAVRVGVTGVSAAFASTGTLLMVSNPGQSRAASLLPYYHIALVPLSRLYPTVEAWLAEHRETGALVALFRGNANVTLISGPSKSADIEQNLTLGVHGPQLVHAILFPG